MDYATKNEKKKKINQNPPHQHLLNFLAISPIQKTLLCQKLFINGQITFYPYIL